uniref:Synergin gamma C-terminal domain-containing protein n=1 Tax=Arion vulgaris TaxID=1028688 RepID=A0A0B7AMM7_9EUPU
METSTATLIVIFDSSITEYHCTFHILCDLFFCYCNLTQGSDRLIQEWERCLQNCYQVISEANTIFNSISSSAICNEVLKSSQGLEYVRSVIEIYRVACRVLTSVRSTAISTTELEKTFKSIDLAWNNLTAFLVGASILPKQTSLVFTHCILKLTSEHAHDLACGVCLLNVDATSAISWPHSGDSTIAS